MRDAVCAVRARTALIPTVALAVDPALWAWMAIAQVEASHPLPRGGELLLGRIEGAAVAAWPDLAARSSAERALPVRIARLLGAPTLLLALRARRLAAAGADLAVVEDHVGVFVPNPLVGPNPDELGPRFPDMTEPYDAPLRALARAEAARLGTALAGGVYAALPVSNLAGGPEYTILQEAGVEWVGEGGVAEVIAARHAGMRVLSLVGSSGAESALAELVRAIVPRLT